MYAIRSLTIAATLANLESIRDFVRASASALGAGPAALSCLLLAVEEAAANVVEHGYGGQGGTLAIELTRDGADIIVRLRDDAPVFDPTQVGPPDLTVPLAERELGRLGVHFMHQFMDAVAHEALPGGGNLLTMRKRVA